MQKTLSHKPANRAQASRNAQHQSAPQEVRIIGGSLKRSKLAVLDAPGLRPTPNRVRETLFNWLGASLEGWHCLDMFAGTGALGLEAASRGAARVLLVERHAQAAQGLKATVQRLKAQACEVLQADALSTANVLPKASFDIVFIDPPFGNSVHARAVQAARPLLKEQGMVYIEAPDAATLDAAATLGYALHKQGKAGAVCFALLVKHEESLSS